MNNFEERMNEIQKRSRARIIRRRKQLTALCVPLVAALCIGGTLIQQHTNGPYEHTVPVSATLPEDSDCVTVINWNKTVSYSDRDIVDAVGHLVSNLLPINDISTDTARNDNRDLTAQFTSLTRNYTIILETEDEVVHYKLVGNMLINLDTAERYALSDVQQATLLTLLELH